MKNAAFALLSALLTLLQAPTTTRMNDRQLDGLKGPAKRVLEESSEPSDGLGRPSAGVSRDRTLIYDRQGRLIAALYAGFGGEKEVRQFYTYDEDGNRHERPGARQASRVQVSSSSQTTSPDLVHKRTFEAEPFGRVVVLDLTYDTAGKLVYGRVDIYDAQSRLFVSQYFNADMKITGRTTFTYKEKDAFPTSWTSFGPDGKPHLRATYSDYKVNAQGDWIRRTEITELSDSRMTRLTYRTIDYY